MDRIIALILGVIVVIGAFFIVKMIITGSSHLGEGSQCLVAGGSCREGGCATGEQPVTKDCGTGQTCCVPGS